MEIMPLWGLIIVGGRLMYCKIRFRDGKTIARLTASDSVDGDEFANSVAISGNQIVVGVEKDDDNGEDSGSAYVFEKPASGWTDMTQTAKLTAFRWSNL